MERFGRRLSFRAGWDESASGPDERSARPEAAFGAPKERVIVIILKPAKVLGAGG